MFSTAGNQAATVSTPEVYVSELGGGYGLAFGSEGVLYTTGRSEDSTVIWKVIDVDVKEVFSTLDYQDPIVELMGYPSDMETNMIVDGAGNIWMTGIISGQCYVAAEGRDARVVYLNQHISVPFERKEDDAQGIAWDEAGGKLYIITSGPSSTYATDAIHHLTMLTPAADGFAQELKIKHNSWDWPPLYVTNEGTRLEQPGVALIKSKTSPLYFLGDNQVYILPEDGKAEPFGEAFGSVRLYGGAVDESGNLYVSVNSEADADDGGGAIYRMDKDGTASQLLKDIGKPLGLAWNGGYLYIMEGAGDRVLRLKTGE